MKQAIELLDIVALVADLPEHGLRRGEIGTVVECYPGHEDYEVEFVANGGSTYAFLTLPASQLVALREWPRGESKKVIPHGRR